MNSVDSLDKIIISNQIIKLVYKHLKLKKTDQRILSNLKQNINDILIDDLNYQEIKHSKSNNSTKKVNSKSIESKTKESKSKVKESKVIEIKDLDLKHYFECQDRHDLDRRLSNIQLLELMDYYGLELTNIKKSENREISIEKLFSLILVLKEEQNKHKSLSFLYENNKNNEINKLWEEKNLLYRNFEINTLLSKSLIYDNIFYIPSQDLFLTLNIRDKRKGKIQEIFVSGDRDLEIIKEEKIKLKNLYTMYTDLVELCELE